MERVTLSVDGRTWGGWLQARITRSLDAAAAGFGVSLTAREPGTVLTAPVRPGSAVTIRVGGDLLITGYADKITPTLDTNGLTLAVEGRSKTGDLVDCTPQPQAWQSVAPLELARQLAAPYGVDVVAASGVDLGGPLRHKVQTGETALACLERALRQRGVLITDDERGRLVLTSPAYTDRAGTALVEGANILSGSATHDASACFAVYACRGQTVPASDADVGAAAFGTLELATDPDIRSARRLELPAEQAINRSGALTRARWEASTRLGKSVQASVVVVGLRETAASTAPLWRPGRTIAISAPSLGLEGDMLITGVSLDIGPNGDQTTLALGLPSAYAPQPITPRTSGRGSSRGVSRPWAELSEPIEVPS